MHTSYALAASFAALSYALPSAYDTTLERRATDPTKEMCFPVASVPASIHCDYNSKGTYGTLKTPSILASSLAAGASYSDQCRDYCESLKTCKSYSFDVFAPTNGCTFYKKSLAAMGYTSAANGAQFFDRKCWKCSTCHLTFKDGTFETGKLAPWQPLVADNNNPTADSVSVVQPNDGSSKYVAQVTSASKDNDPFGNGSGILQGFFGQCNGTTYNISWDFRVTNYANAVIVALWVSKDDPNTAQALYVNSNVPVDGWHTFSTSFTPRFSNYGEVQLKAIGRDSNQVTIQYDNITITPA